MPSQLVRSATAHYDDLLATRFAPSGWWQQYVHEVRKHWQDDVAVVDSFVLRPFMIDEATYAQIRSALEGVMSAFSIATERLVANAGLRRALGIPAYLDPLLEIDRAHGKPTCLGRLDGLMSNGELQIIEHNSEPQTVAFQHELEQSFERLAITEEFRRTFSARTVNLYDQVFDVLRARGRDGRMPCVAVLDKMLWKSSRRASRYRPLMYCSGRGCPVLYVEPEELEYRDGKLTCGGLQVDMVAFAGWDLLINARKRLVKVTKAISDGAVDVFAGLSRGLLASYKVVFELLSSPQYRDLFPAEFHPLLARHVPWTRVLRERTTDHDGSPVDLLPFVQDHRARLVIKPAGGSGGGDVTVGRDVTDEQWAAVVKRGAAQSWVVQALVEPERQEFPVVDASGTITRPELNCELTPYVWNGRTVEGALCRVTSGSVLHDDGRAVGIANGIETPTWIIGDQRGNSISK